MKVNPPNSGPCVRREKWLRNLLWVLVLASVPLIAVLFSSCGTAPQVFYGCLERGSCNLSYGNGWRYTDISNVGRMWSQIQDSTPIPIYAVKADSFGIPKFREDHTVCVRMFVKEDGILSHALAGDHRDEFHKLVAVDAAMNWRFKPLVRDGILLNDVSNKIITPTVSDWGLSKS
jgi:hypothetical protein